MNDLCIGRKQSEKSRNRCHAYDHQHQPVQRVQKHPLRRRPICLLILLRSQIISDHCIDTYAEANGHRIDHILQRVNQ